MLSLINHQKILWEYMQIVGFELEQWDPNKAFSPSMALLSSVIKFSLNIPVLTWHISQYLDYSKSLNIIEESPYSYSYSTKDKSTNISTVFSLCKKLLLFSFIHWIVHVWSSVFKVGKRTHDFLDFCATAFPSVS